MQQKIYLEGCPFPEASYQNFEGPVVLFSGSRLELLVFKPWISEGELNGWATASINYGLYVRDDIPFFVTKLSHSIYLDSSLNMKSLCDDELQSRLDSMETQATLVLTDSATFHIRLVRMFLLTKAFIDQLKPVLLRQVKRYHSYDQVDERISWIQAKMPDSLQLFRQIRDIHQVC